MGLHGAGEAEPGPLPRGRRQLQGPRAYRRGVSARRPTENAASSRAPQPEATPREFTCMYIACEASAGMPSKISMAQEAVTVHITCWLTLGQRRFSVSCG